MMKALIKSKYTIPLFSIIMLSLWCTKLGAVDEIFFKELKGSPIANGSFMTIKDNRFGNSQWNAIEQHLSVKNLLLFEIDESSSQLKPNQTCTYEASVQVELWMAADNPSGSPSQIIQETLQITYDGDAEKSTQYQAFKIYEDAHQMRVTVTSILPVGGSCSAGWPPFRVYGEISVDRIYNFNPSLTPFIYSIPSGAQINYYDFSWLGVFGVEEYDVEWTFYDKKSEVGNLILTNDPTSYPDYNWLFQNNATRVTTAQNTYRIRLLYPEGYLFMRVRAARYNADGIREYGDWTSQGSGTLSNFTHKIQVGWHENNTLNWQSSVVFAEEGKNVPGVQYFDGTLRQRQGVTLSNAIDQTIVSQTIYDHHGRPSINLLPAPSGNNNLAFDPLFATFSAGVPYGKQHFDEGSCEQVGTPMSIGTGPSKYYSPNNPLVNTDQHQYIPDAEGFPFTQVEFTPDNTGRIKKQSGVGDTYKMNGGKETEYFYAKPTQKELDRLFGNDVGFAAHYQKHFVKDANGQLSVSYIDAHGRTIATALAGEKPAEVNQIDQGYDTAVPLQVALLDNIQSENSLASVQKFVVATPGNYSFNYSLDPKTYSKACLDPTICLDCLYELRITITDSDCNAFNSNQPYVFEDKNFSFATGIDTLCTQSSSGGGFSQTITLNNLPIGEYTITKELRLSEAGMETYTATFINNNTCIPSLQELIDDYRNAVDTTGCDYGCDECIDDLGTETEFVANLIQEITSSGDNITQQEAEAEYAARYAECEALCYIPTECEIIFELMLADVTPGGQYALFTTNSGDNITHEDQTSIFYQNRFQTLNAGLVYLDDSGNPDMVYNSAGQLVAPTQLTAKEFLQNWKDSWAEPLVITYHPEYCIYDDWCGDVTYQNSDKFDRDLDNVESYQEAIDSGWVDVNGNILNDPFFAPGGPGADCVGLLDSMLANIVPGDASTPSVIEYVEEQVMGPENCSGGLGNGDTNQNDYAWEMYRNIYMGIKYQLKSKKRSEINCNPDVDCIDAEDMATCNGQPNLYQFKKRRIIDINYDGQTLDINSLNTEVAALETEVITSCQTSCEYSADIWIGQLAPCDYEALTSQQKTDLRERLIEVCQLACDLDHPNGASTTPPGETTSYGYSSFEDIVAFFFPSASACNLDCAPSVITALAPYETQVYQGPQLVQTVSNTCICERITDLEACYNALPGGTYPSFTEYLRQFSETSLEEEEIDIIKEYCGTNPPSLLLPEAIYIPPYLECGVCKTCDEVTALVDDFKLTCAETNPDFDELLARHLNKELGFALSGSDYQDFLDKCDQGTTCADALMLCPTAPDDLTPVEEINPCIAELYAQAEVSAGLAYQELVAALRQEFQSEYRSQCFTGLNEIFTGTIIQHEYHYTLYYYDQAGNLVQTVPPTGVSPITSTTDLDQVDNYRTNGTGNPVYANHSYLTKYVYNSLDQVIREINPDSDEKEFWYDRIGRLVISQDGRQRPNNLYSYTRHDALGRIIEVGEKLNTSPMTQATALNDVALESWILAGNANTRTEITRTYYDDAPYNISAFDASGQENLRTRVATTTFEAVNDDNTSTYDFGTHYSYDASGFVKTLVQEIADLDAYDQGYKRIDYEYDYISGNVHKVYYQKGQPDQFTHAYSYDENNRLVNVKTSLVKTTGENALWEEDAAYTYYDHGPLARVKIGERAVQGTDYAYNLQGWIKGMNSSGLSPDKDMGRDGATTGSNTFIARDVLGYALGYFENDYQSISSQAFEMTVVSGSGLNTNSPNLYNGNIRYMVIHNKQLGGPHGYSYAYDQLHRIKRMQTFTNANLSTFAWDNGGSPLTAYQMQASYDGNGNITSLDRWGDQAGFSNYQIDDLTYDYEPGTNKLLRVQDNIASGAFTGDVDSQIANNYSYDGSGNLTGDLQAGATLTWNPYGKVKQVARSAANQQTNFSYDAAQNRVIKAQTNTSTQTTTYTYYIRDAQGNTMAVYERDQSEVTWKEQYLFGSSRLGSLRPDVTWNTSNPYSTDSYFTTQGELQEGWKQYELSNHLGNVLATINDRKTGIDTNSDNDADYYEANILSANDYYPFGMDMPGRQYSLNGYRFGFNGKEKDTEGEWGDLTHYDYGFRIYNPGIGKFLSVDPLTKSYPSWTPYAFGMNRVIDGIDLDGLEWKSQHKWSDKLDDEALIKSYGSEIVAQKTTTLFGIKLKTRDIAAWEQHKGKTYKDLWQDKNPSLQRKYADTGQEFNCANICIQLLVDFSYENRLPIHFEDHKAKSVDPTFDNDDYGYTNKQGQRINLEEGDWQGLAKAIQNDYGAADLYSNRKLTLIKDDINQMVPGDLTSVQWKLRDGQPYPDYHAQTVGWLGELPSNSGTGLTSIQFGTFNGTTRWGAPGDEPLSWRQYPISDFLNRTGKTWINANKSRLVRWNFDRFDKKK